MFYETFLQDIINKKNPRNFKTKALQTRQFVENLLDTNKLSYELIKTVSRGYLDYLKKPQRNYYSTDYNYIAVDMNTNLHYICYKNILMIDIDLKEGQNKQDVLKDIIKKISGGEDSFLIYESTNGYHIFMTSRTLEYNSEEAINILIDFGSDTNYIICSYLRGFCVRLNRKNTSEPDTLYKFIGYYHNTRHEDVINLENKTDIEKCIISKLSIHDFMIEKFKNFIVY